MRSRPGSYTFDRSEGVKGKDSDMRPAAAGLPDRAGKYALTCIQMTDNLPHHSPDAGDTNEIKKQAE